MLPRSLTAGPPVSDLSCLIGDFFEPFPKAPRRPSWPPRPSNQFSSDVRRFVVVPTCASHAWARPTSTRSPPPPFDEGFFGYGKNKMEWIASLRVANFTFATVARAFIARASRV